MPHLRTATKSPTPQARNRHATGAGPHGIALMPPAYGLDVVDQAATGEGPLQLRSTPAHAPVQRQAPATPPNRTGLPDRLKAGIESLSGYDLSNVRVHYNSSQPAQLQALAYTQGTDIYVAPGQERHLPHEVWHVVQQKQGRVRPTLQMKDGVPVNDDQGLEHEADMMGATVMQTRRSEKRALAFPLHQESMNLQGVIQRYIISVNHALRDPKATPSDDYGTYRSLDVAIAAGGGEIYKGVNTQGKGGRLDDFTSRTPPEEAKNVTLKKNEDLYLVGHGSKGSIGAIPPTTVAKAVAKITPNDWQGKIYSLNCWAGYKSSETQPSALDTLADLLGKAGRKGIEVSGPKGVSFRHKDWLKDKQLPLGAKAVFSYTENDESTYKDLIIAESTSSFLAGLKAAKVDDAFDHLLSFLNSKGYLEPEGTMTGVKKKAAFATEWGRPFQTKVVEKLETEATNSLAKARDEKRLLFGTEGIRTVKS